MASTRTGALSTTPLVMSEARAARYHVEGVRRAQSAVFGEAPGQNALFGPAAIEERLQSAVFREPAGAECGFP